MCPAPPPFPPPQVVSNRFFEYTMLILIMASSLQLCFDDASVEPGTSKYDVLRGMDIFFAIAFGIEVGSPGAAGPCWQQLQSAAVRQCGSAAVWQCGSEGWGAREPRGPAAVAAVAECGSVAVRQSLSEG